MVRLRDGGDGTFKLVVKAKQWFGAADANQSAANTTLTVRIGAQCMALPLTAKID
ncbi:hypothetical protein D3C83_262760 [compost metagenome]